MQDLFNGIFNNRKVLVTGHTGFKGSWLCLLLHKLGADVYGYALDPPTNPSLFKEAKIEKLITSFIHDIRDYENLCEVVQKIQPEMVIPIHTEFPEEFKKMHKKVKIVEKGETLNF